MWAAETVQGRGSLEVRMGWRCARQGRESRLGGRPGWAAGHPYAAAGGGIDDGVRGVYWPAGSIRGATTPGDGGHDLPRPAPTREKPKAAFMPPPAGGPGRV